MLLLKKKKEDYQLKKLELFLPSLQQVMERVLNYYLMRQDINYSIKMMETIKVIKKIIKLILLIIIIILKKKIKQKNRNLRKKKRKTTVVE